MFKNRKLYIGLCVIVVSAILVVLNIMKSPINDLELVQVEQHSKAEGLLLEELTFDNLVNQYSTDIVLGIVEEKLPFTSSNNLFTVKVKEVLSGTIDSDKIEVYVVDEELLDVGSEYILFLTKKSSTLYSKDFYVQFGQFIVKVVDDNVLRLVNIETDEYVEPFVKDEYNKANSLIRYIKETTKNKVPSVTSKAIDKASTVEELYSLSEHIIEINTIQVEPVKNSLSTVKFEISKTFKGDELKNVHALLLPDNKVKSDKTYLLFLKKNGESVTLTTREGSIIEENDMEYGETIKSLMNLK